MGNWISDFIINVFYNQSLVYGYKEVWLKRKSHLKTLRTKTICLPHQNKVFRQTKYLFCLVDRRHPKLALIINHQNNGQIFSSRHICDVLGYLVRYDPSLGTQQGKKIVQKNPHHILIKPKYLFRIQIRMFGPPKG